MDEKMVLDWLFSDLDELIDFDGYMDKQGLKNMREESILRLAISMEDQAPTTIDKYICKLAECVFVNIKTRPLSWQKEVFFP